MPSDADGPDVGSIPGGPDRGSSYIRGGTARGDARQVVRVVVGLWIVTLVVVIVVFSVIAAHRNSRVGRLRQQGVAVQITVTQCVGLLSGTGMTEYEFSCNGSFVLGGHRYTEGIRGTGQDYKVGTSLPGVADAANPADLTLATAVSRSHQSWTAYAVPGSFFIVLLLTFAALWWRVRASRTRNT